jgi:hypothetical protein
MRRLYRFNDKRCKESSSFKMNILVPSPMICAFVV